MTTTKTPVTTEELEALATAPKRRGRPAGTGTTKAAKEPLTDEQKEARKAELESLKRQPEDGPITLDPPAEAEFPVLSLIEEANGVLEDIYGEDSEAARVAVEELAEAAGIAVDWDINGDELANLILDNEDELLIAAGVVYSDTMETGTEGTEEATEG
jgi:hypothetical protein